MATGKVVGQIQVTQGNIKVIGVDGAVREPGYEGYVYENEQVISNDPNALFQIKFLALPESSAYDGIFRILADGSVIHGRDAMDSMMSDENLVKVLETASVGDVKTAGEDIGDLETAAGEEGAEGSSSFTETDIVAESSVLGFSRGTNGALGFGITDFGSVPNYDAGQIAPPAITSPNVVVYDENDTIPVIQITATAEGSVTYSIGGLDSGFFDIDSATGLVTFKESPDFENPRDSGGDNEYNTYVTVTDSYGNYTTQLLSVSINNLNEAVTAFDDTVDAVEDTILSSTIDLDANDTDLDGDALSVVGGTYTTAQGGEIVIAADGSYTYTPALNFNGTDTVNYTVTDGEFTDVGMLTINVAAVDDAPPPPPPPPPPPIDYTFADANESVSGDEGMVQTGTVLENTTDEKGLPLSVTAFMVDGDDTTYNAGDTATIAGKGSLTIESGGTYTFEPEANYNGEVPVATYTVTNGETTDTSTLTIYVNAVSDEFTDNDEYTSGIEDTIQTGTVLENVTDENGLPLSVTEFRIDGDEATYSADETAIIADVGSLTIGSDGTYTFEPVDNYSGDVPTVIYTVSNGETTDSSALTITVDAAADVPSLTLDIESTEKIKSEWVVDEEANAAAGIYLEEDGLYYKVVISDEYGLLNYKLNQGHFITFEQSMELADVVKLDTRFTGNASGTVKFFEGDTLIDELALVGEKNVDILHTYTPSGSFDNIVFVIGGQSVIFLNSYSFEYLVPMVVDPIKEELTTTVYEYTIIPEATPTDTDGSEELGEVEFGGIPEGVDLIDNGDGTYTFESDEQLSSDVLDGITATVTSTEDSNGDEATVTVNQNGIVSIEGGSGNDTLMGEDGDEVIDGGDGNDYIDGGEGSDTIYGGADNDTIVYDSEDTEIDGGEESDILIVNSGDIDFSNVSNIEEIDLSSGDYTLSNITLVDVIDITDGDKVLKITGDSGDGVDNLADNGWVLDTSPDITEVGYVTYTNIADSSVQLLIDEDIIIITD